MTPEAISLSHIQHLLRLLDDSSHPSAEECRQTLTNDDALQAYRAASLLTSAFRRKKEVHPSEFETNVQWKRVSARLSHRPQRLALFRKAAAVAAVAFVGLGLSWAVGSRWLSLRSESPSSAPASAPVASTQAVPEAPSPALSLDTLARKYENAALETILTDMARHYHMQVVWKTALHKQLRLYYEWDPREGLAEALEELNVFEKVSVRRENDKLIVE